MLYDVMVRNGIKRENLTGDVTEALIERAFQIPEWILFRYGNQTYYRTFENHLYKVVKVKR